MSEQCKSCIHESVCAYKEHYEDAMKKKKKAREECGKYPWFKFKIECIQYRKIDFPLIRGMAESEG